MKTAILHIRLDPELLARVKAQAEREDRDLTRCVTRLLERWVIDGDIPPEPSRPVAKAVAADAPMRRPAYGALLKAR